MSAKTDKSASPFDSDAVIPIYDGDISDYLVIYNDPLMDRLLSLAESVARTSSTVLLSGESGTGKEVIARYIHRRSDRCDRPFIGINCAALPASLLESELFGHEKGSFTGAVKRHQGIFERAYGGTILLDEISEMPLELQAKFLRVLQERRMNRVGGSDSVELDIRVIATTNRDLLSWVQEGQFRMDLYYRLNVFPLQIPALRERPGDIEPLIRYYLRKFVAQFGSPVRGIRGVGLKRLKSYSFPGNVRELHNILERAVILAGNNHVIEDEHLMLKTNISVMPFEHHASAELGQENSAAFKYNDYERASHDEITDGPEDNDSFRLSFVAGDEPLTDIRRQIILKTLTRFEGNRSKTADALGVSVRTIRNKLRDYRAQGISVPDSE